MVDANDNTPAPTIQYDVKPLFTGTNRGWLLLDLLTAKCVLALFEAVDENRQVKLNRVPFLRLADFAFRIGQVE